MSAARRPGLRRGWRWRRPAWPLGLLAAVPLARTMQSLLHDMRAIDAGVFTTVAVALLAVGILASFGPARRAAGVDPIVALREE